MAVAIDTANLPNLTTSDYSLSYDGTNYTLERLDTGATRTFPGGAAFTADGLSFTPSGTAAAGDSYRIMPTKYAGRSIDVRVTDPTRLALAGPVRATTTLARQSKFGQRRSSCSSTQTIA
jgi:flagellar hook-associated protein 1 FlgK